MPPNDYYSKVCPDPSKTFTPQESMEELNKQVAELVRRLRQRDEMLELQKKQRKLKKRGGGGVRTYNPNTYRNLHQSKKPCWENWNDPSTTPTTVILTM